MGCVWLAVVPIVPAVPTLLLLLVMIALSCWTALLSLRNPGSWWRIGRLLWSQRWWIAALALLYISVVSINPWPTAQPSIPAEAAGGKDWPTDRGDLRRWGAAEGHLGPTQSAARWTFGGAAVAFYSSPAIRGDRIYIVGSHGDRGQIYCLHAKTGALLWSAAPAGYRATFSSPVIAGDYLVCGEGLHHTRQARVVCVDLRPGHEGEIVWTWTTQSHVECTPVVNAGRVYVGAGDDGYYCLDLKPDANGEPRVLWHREGHEFPDAETSLAVHAGKVYAGLGIGGQALCVLDANDGREIRRIKFPYPVFSPPSIHQGKLFVGMGIGDYVTPNRAAAGQVCCIDLATNEIVWTVATPATVLGAIAVADDRLVFGCADGAIYALDFQGQNQRQLVTGAAIVASIAIDGETIFAVNGDGVLWAVDLQTLRPRWQQRLGSAGRYVSSPLVAHGHVYVGTEHNGLQCIGARLPHVEQTSWPSHLGGPGKAGRSDDSALPAVPRLLWRFPADPHADASRVVAPVAISSQLLLVPVAEGSHAGMLAVPASHASQTPIQPVWTYPIADGVWTSAAVHDRHVYCVSGRTGKRGRKLHCLQSNDGQRVWDVPLDMAAPGELHVDLQGVVASVAPSYLAAINNAGKVTWYFAVPGQNLQYAVTADVIAVASASPNTLSLLDRPTGTELWRESMEAEIVVRPVIIDDQVVLGTTAGIEIRSLIDGKRVRYVRNGRPLSDFYWDEQQYAVVTARSLIVGDRLSRRRLRLPSGLFTTANPLVAGDTVVVAGSTQLWRAALGDRDSELQSWFDMSAHQATPGSMVLHGGRLYVSGDAAGLLCLGEESSQ